MNSKTTEQAAEEKELLLEIDKIVDNLECSYDPDHSYNTSGIVIENQHVVVNELHDLFTSTITTLQAEVDRLRALVPMWVDISEANAMDTDRTIVLFEDGSIKKYLDYWPRLRVIGCFELPSPPINQEK